MAPEVVCHERYSKSADVFSFGCLVFELITHEQPFSDRTPLQAAVAVGLNHQRPPLPPELPPPLRELVRACWHQDATERMTFALLHPQLDAMRLTDAESAWLDAPGGHPVYQHQAAQKAAPPAGTGAAMPMSGVPSWLSWFGLREPDWSCAAPRRQTPSTGNDA